MTEFICRDCRVDIYEPIDTGRERCALCQWIADLPDHESREAARALRIRSLQNLTNHRLLDVAARAVHPCDR